jgi:predicted transcriptional regulator
LYGEFKEASKLWRILHERGAEPWLSKPSLRWDLLNRACRIESKYEALLVKLATERPLDIDQTKLLGLFRQTIQQLRECIRDNKLLASSSRGAEYVLLNLLAARVAEVICDKHSTARPSASQAASGLQSIAAVSLETYEKWVEERRSSILVETGR